MFKLMLDFYMIKSRWYLHPLTIFITSLIALITSLVVYIRSYLNFTEAFHEFLDKNDLDTSQILDPEAWLTISVLSILFTLIVVGMALIYVYYRKMIQLYRMQQNFINGFTHELKTPIASLRLFLETFSRHEIPRNEQLKYFDFMSRDVDRLSDNVEQILSLGKIEDKKYKTEFHRRDLASFIEEKIEESPHLYEDLKITVSAENGPYIYPIDTSLFSMLIMNLITNSIRYNEKENRTLNIEFKYIKNRLLVTFMDNGIGIEKNELKKVFKKFYQVGKSSKGSGLGLYFAQNIMRIHKGSIWVESEGLDKGSRFVISFAKEEK